MSLLRCLLLIVLGTSAGCGEEPATLVSTPGGYEGVATEEPAPASDEPAESDESHGIDTASAPPPPPPTQTEIDGAREACGRGYTHLREGRILDAANLIDPALRVLRRSTSEADRRAFGACLYNSGRLAEEQLYVDVAREQYTASYDVRSNPIVRRRIRQLGTRDVYAPPGREEMIANQLRRADNHPCGSRVSRCEVLVHVTARSGGGRLLRAALVSVASDLDDEVGDLYLAWTGPRGAYRWGPKIATRSELSFDYDEPLLTMGFRPIIPNRPWLLFVRMETRWTERCCGGIANGREVDLSVCELGEDEGRCVFVAEVRECEGSSDEPDIPDYESCDHSEQRFVTVDSEGITSRDSGGVAEPSRVVSGQLEGVPQLEGAHPWTTLFPEPAGDEAGPSPSPSPSPGPSPSPAVP